MYLIGHYDSFPVQSLDAEEVDGTVMDVVLVWVDDVEATCNTDSWFKFGGPPSARNDHLAVFTGTELIVWGGEGQNDGRRYDLATDTWNRMAFAGAPPAGVWPGVWTGTASTSRVWCFTRYGSTTPWTWPKAA